jgi:hypothetical protein
VCRYNSSSLLRAFLAVVLLGNKVEITQPRVQETFVQGLSQPDQSVSSGRTIRDTKGTFVLIRSSPRKILFIVRFEAISLQIGVLTSLKMQPLLLLSSGAESNSIETGRS